MKGLEAMAQRLTNAEGRFVQYVRDAIGCTGAEARSLLAAYKKHGLIRLDPVGGQWTTSHGSLIEPEALRAALGNITNGRG